jgi:hypothetical protein
LQLSYKNSWNSRKIDPKILEFQVEIPQGLKASPFWRLEAYEIFSISNGATVFFSFSFKNNSKRGV